MKICDFGVAKILEDKEATMSTNCGTLAYQAPEVIQGQKYDSACDIWSIGIVLYVMLCGYSPFDSDDNTENRNNILAGNYTFASPDWDNVSEQGTPE